MKEFMQQQGYLGLLSLFDRKTGDGDSTTCVPTSEAPGQN